MKFEKVIKGILKYLNDEIYVGMNDWQEMLARVAVSRLFRDTNALKTALLNNGFIRTFAIMDDSGEVDFDNLFRDIRAQVEQKGKITVSLPMFGNFIFTPPDVDKLYQTILNA